MCAWWVDGGRSGGCMGGGVPGDGGVGGAESVVVEVVGRA
jgi:hypothetical protein